MYFVYMYIWNGTSRYIFGNCHVKHITSANATEPGESSTKASKWLGRSW